MKVVSWKGNSINDGTNYVAGMLNPVLGLPKVKVALTGRLGRWPVASGVERPGRAIVLEIILLGDLDTQQAAINAMFDPEDETAGQLIISDNDGSNQRYVMALCEELVEEQGRAGQVFQAVLVIDGDVRWRAVTADSVEWNITATGQTKVVANGGTDDAYPVLTVQPTTAKTGGYSYRRALFVIWQLSEGFSRYPLDVADGLLALDDLRADATRSVQVNQGGGINNVVTTIPYDTETGTFPDSGLCYVDSEQISYTGKTGTDLTGCTRGVNGTGATSHADDAVIYASKVQADWDDVRLLVDGIEVSRWIGGSVSAASVWTVLDFQPAASGTITAAIAGSGAVDTIDINEDISGFPDAGALLIGSECFIYTSKNKALGRFLGVTRASKGTSEAAHSLGDSVYWLQHDITLIYGNPSVEAPTVVDADEPIMDLSGSSNTVWDYTDGFGEDDVDRPGTWVRQEWVEYPPGKKVDFYTDDQYTYTSPWDVAGIHVKNTIQIGSGQVPLGRWGLYNPCGITNLNASSGEKYVERDLTEWYAELQSSVDGSNWITEYVITAPTALDTWQSWSQSQALDSGSKWAGVMLTVADGGGKKDTRRVGMKNAVVTLNGTYTPAATMGAETGNYPLACRITNNTTGDAVDLNFMMVVNGELELDTAEKTVVYLDDGSNQFQALTVVGGARRDWLPLAPGNNTLQFDDDDTVAVTVTVDFEERYYQ